MGDIERSSEQLTQRAYNTGAMVRLTPEGYRATGRPGIAAYLEEPRLSLDAEAEALRRALYKAAHGSDEWAERCDRMLMETCGRFVPAEVYAFARAAGLLATGVVYGRISEDRLRRTGMLAEIAAEARIIEGELRGAA